MDTKTKETEKDVKKIGRSSVIDFLIIGIITLACSAAGFGLSRLIAKPSPAEQTDEAATDNSIEQPNITPREIEEKSWFYDLEPVVANLDVPGATRFVRASLTLEMNPALEEAKGRELVDYKSPILKNWLTVYLASLSLDDVRGDRNLRRIQAHTLQAFNEELFGDSEPMIKNILFKEFPIQ